MRSAWQLASIIIVILGGGALAQGLLPLSGSIFPTPDDLNHRHMSPYGKPCLTFEGDVRPEGPTASFFGSTGPDKKAEPGALPVPKIYEHGIKVSNSCGQNIKVKVCYYKTDECIMLNVPPWDKKEAVLGIYPGLSGFRYEAKEQFP